MKLLWFSICIICSITCSYGQVRTQHLPVDYSKDTTSIWHKRAQLREQKIGLKPIEKSPYLFHFRFSVTGGEIVDIWQKDTLFQGCFTKWVKDSDEDLGTFERIFSRQYVLGASQAAAIGQLVKISGILQLPDDKAIKGWIWGVDGEVLTVEYVQGNNYYLKSYWTPTAQHSVPEAALIHQFNERIFELLNSKTVRKAFEAEIPFPCYGSDGMTYTCRGVTTTQYWQHKREVKRYVHQMQAVEKQLK